MARLRLRLARGALALALYSSASGHAWAQSQSPSTWRGDIPFLLAAIDSIHPRPYRLHPRAEWDSAAADLERRLPALQYHQAVAGIARLVALAGDGHTRLEQLRLPSHARPELNPMPGPGFERLYPVAFRVFADGLFVIHTGAGNDRLLDQRVVAIHGKPTAAAVEALRPFISADNEMWTLYLFPEYLRSPAYVHAAGLSDGIDAPLRLTVQGSKGGPREMAVPPVRRDSSEMWIEPKQPRGGKPSPLHQLLTDNYSFRDLGGDPRTVYVRYRQVRNAEGGETIARFADRLFGYADSAGVERLIVDIRTNGGGDNYLNQPLVHGLIASRRVNRPGRLFVITDRGTFSAAVSFAADVERNTHALFAGEPTGDPPNSCGDPRRVTLPASGIVVRVSALYWQQSDPRDARRWIAPDLPAPESFADYLAVRDPALEAVMAYRDSETTAPRPPNQNWVRKSQEQPPPPIRW